MREEHVHVRDEDLLLHASGECSAISGDRIQDHLAGCAKCRARLRDLESTLAEFAEAHARSRDVDLPTVAGPLSALKARLAEMGQESVNRQRAQQSVRSEWLGLTGLRGAALLAGVAAAACLMLAIRLHAPAGTTSRSASLGYWEEPDLRLTPGATVPVTEIQVCGSTGSKTAPVVPASLKHKVFELYGVRTSQPDGYEVDYLITPELGGATDIRNLWPEPYEDTVWNAHVKDQLEDRLHQMVCHGEVDLATAQHDIAADWIAAYRKYFHAQQPIAANTSFNYSILRPSVPLT